MLSTLSTWKLQVVVFWDPVKIITVFIDVANTIHIERKGQSMDIMKIRENTRITLSNKAFIEAKMS